MEILRTKTANVLYGTGILLFLLIGRILGTQGELVLIGTACSGLAFMMFGGMLLFWYFSGSKELRKGAALWTFIVGISLFGYGVFTEAGALSDYIRGTRVESLTDCHVSYRVGVHGILGNSYYLNGTDRTGKHRNFPISFTAWKELDGITNVTIWYYPHAGKFAAQL